jgi:hypothetical protein
MSDDLVKRLRGWHDMPADAWFTTMETAADRIEKLEAANLKQSCIKVDDQMRIEKLEAALREISSVSKVYVAKGEDMAQALTILLASHRKIALAALEGKDG